MGVPSLSFNVATSPSGLSFRASRSEPEELKGLISPTGLPQLETCASAYHVVGTLDVQRLKSERRAKQLKDSNQKAWEIKAKLKGYDSTLEALLNKGEVTFSVAPRV